jgi:OFA family oxalate/formate antiporter-like MFS transporter
VNTSEGKPGTGEKAEAGSSLPTRRYYGVYMVPVAVAIVVCTLPGQTIVVSQFNGAIREALGLTLSQISLAYLIGTSLAALPLTLVGRAADRFGLRIVVGVVAASFSLALVLLGQVWDLLSLTAGFALVRFLGQGSLGMLSSHTLAMWFERRLGVMTSIKHVGFSLGALVLPLVTVAMIEAVGWRHTLALLGAGVALFLLPLVLTVFRNRPEDVGQVFDGGERSSAALVGETPHPPTEDAAFTLGEALRTRALWILLLTGPFLGLVGTAMLFHTQPLLASLGVENSQTMTPRAQAPWAMALAITPLFAGYLADTFHPRWLLPVGLSLCAASSGCLALAGQGAFGWSPLVWVGLGMGVFGVAGGVVVSVSGPTIARYFGRTHHGSIRGATITVAVAATATGPYLLSKGAELAEGRFDVVFAVFALAALPLAATALTLKQPQRA